MLSASKSVSHFSISVLINLQHKSLSKTSQTFHSYYSEYSFLPYIQLNQTRTLFISGVVRIDERTGKRATIETKRFLSFSTRPSWRNESFNGNALLFDIEEFSTQRLRQLFFMKWNCSAILTVSNSSCRLPSKQ